MCGISVRVYSIMSQSQTADKINTISANGEDEVSGQWTVNIEIGRAVYMPICSDLWSQHKVSRQSGSGLI